MKRWIHGTDEPFQSKSILDVIDKIDLVIIANDARTLTLGELPIVASSNGYSKDFDQFSKEELIEVDPATLRTLTSFYTLDLLQEAYNEGESSYKLTQKQQKILQGYYKQREYSAVELSKSEIDRLLKKIADCKHTTGPGYRKSQPEKNFAQLHGFKMIDDDYLAIIKLLSEGQGICKGALKSAELDRLGILLYEFVYQPQGDGYHLIYSDQVISTDIRIYIKILPNYEEDCNIAIISFHDAEYENLADAED